MKPIYNMESELEEYDPPNSPEPIRKSKNTYLKKIKNGIDINNIIQGVGKHAEETRLSTRHHLRIHHKWWFES